MTDLGYKGPEKSTSVFEDGTDVSAGSLDNISWWEIIRSKIELPPGETRWSNEDLDPIPPERQNWRTYNFVTYWISDAFAVTNWRAGSTLIEIGLSWKLALVVTVLGNFITALVVTFNGLIGARLHIPFTVQARSAYGFYFAYVITVLRVIVSVFWYGLCTYTGAQCVQSMLFAIWPSFRNVPNQLPPSANTTTQFMISYIIYFIILLPFHYIPVVKIRWFFTIKSIVSPIAGFAIMGWMIQETGGGKETFAQENTVHGRALSWAFMSGLNVMIGSFATLGVNMNDFARYSRNPKSPYIQLFIVPVATLMMVVFGIVGANGSKVLYGELLWDPLLIMDMWTSPRGRAAAFFGAFAFLIATIGTSVSANSLAVGVDLATLFPKPWNILASAQALVSFMSGYTIWLAPMAGILLADYYIVNNRKLYVPDMYRPQGIYGYERWGTNWRAVVAFVVGFGPLLPGFARSVRPNHPPTKERKMPPANPHYPPRTPLTPAQLTTAISACLTLQESGRTTHSKRPFAALLLGPDNSTILLTHLSISHIRHAESELARLASDHYSEPYLWRCTLVSTWEPCAMCAGTIYWANIGRVVYVASERELLKLTGEGNLENVGFEVPCRVVFGGGQKDVEVIGPVGEGGWEGRVVEMSDRYWGPAREGLRGKL
ncbi:hypothetical protein FQN50_001786 [Emmonsiellopsis sp. PD_5]|nr:hypothetical protein FQN50_001786 [Emmonsiellopsis sp. PD_5]